MLGMKIYRNKYRDMFRLSQNVYTDLEKEGMRQISYASVIASPMYAQAALSLIVAYGFSFLGGSNEMQRCIAAKKTMIYLQSTKDSMLVYNNNDGLAVVGYTNLILWEIWMT